MDFIELTTQAYAPDISPTHQKPLLDELFINLFALESWIFSATITPEGPIPFISTYNDKQWLFAFTDSDLLARFVKENNPSDQNGPDSNITFLTIPRAGIVNWLERMGAQGVAGVQFNFAGPGWFVPMENFRKIIQHLELAE